MGPQSPNKASNEKILYFILMLSLELFLDFRLEVIILGKGWVGL